MADENNLPAATTDDSVPPPPAGFQPVQQNATADEVPPPPAGFAPVAPPQTRAAGTHARPNAAPGTTGALGVLSGIGGGVMETAQGVKELANKVLPSGAQIPDIPANLRESRTPEESAGNFLETVGEFAVGDEALKGVALLDKLSKTPRIIQLMEQYPKASKMILSMAKAAGVSGTQAGVKAAAEKEPVLPAVKEGAEGGAAGSALAEVAAPVLGKAAKAVGLGTSAEEDITRAAQPGKRNYRFISDWAQAKDRIAAEIEENGKFKDMGDAADRIRDVRQGLWNNEVVPVLQKHANEQFDASSVARAVRKKITPEMAQHAPEEAKILEEFANKYTSGTPNFSGAKTVAQAEKELEFFNAQLDKDQYWKKTPMERAALQKVDGKVASRAAAVDALRDSLYDHLTNNGEPQIKDIKQTYGAIKNVENEIRGQVNVGGRQRPISLKQVIGLAAGLAHGGPGGAAAAALPMLDKLYNEPTALLNRAVSKSQPPGALRAAAQDVVSGAGSVAKTAAPVVGEDWVRFTGSDGKTYRAHPEDVDKVKERDPGATFEQSEPPYPHK